MDMRILELATEITRQALATEKNALGLQEEVAFFLDRMVRKLAELQQTPAGKDELGFETCADEVRIRGLSIAAGS